MVDGVGWTMSVGEDIGLNPLRARRWASLAA